MRCGPRARCIFSVSLWAWLLYFVSSLGYFLVDGLAASYTPLTDYQWNTLYTTLAVASLVDALLYMVEWFREAPRPLRIDEAAWANFVNVFASAIYVLSSSMFFFFPPIDAGGALARSHATVQAAMNLLGITLFFLDALLFNSWYYNERPHQSSLYFWGEVFNTVPSLGYLCTAVAQLAASLYYGPTTPAKAHRQLLGQLSMANLLFDLLYCVDALLVGWEWFKSETEPPSDDIDGADEHSDTSANEFKALVNATPVDFAPI